MIRSIPLALRRVRQTLAGFENGPTLLLDMARQSMTGKPEELVFQVDKQCSITVPNRPGARVPVYEIFVEDEYRIDWFTSDLGDEPIALDIGAHVGCFSVAFASKHLGGRVYSYEASPSTATYLQRNIADCGLDSRVTGNNLAVQGAAGTLELADNGAGSGHNGVLHLTAESKKVSVRSVAMSEALLAGGRTADIVKIDTEGGEYDMILGSEPSDWAGVRRVVLEYHDLPGHSWEELEEFFTSAGLTLVHREKFLPRLGMAWLSRGPIAG